jgi:hypothetical protein
MGAVSGDLATGTDEWHAPPQYWRIGMDVAPQPGCDLQLACLR